VNPCPNAGKSWLSRLNYWRSTAGLPPVVEDPNMSAGDYDHAVWMVKNETLSHSESPGSPYYTAAGNTAAQNSNVELSSSTATTDVSAIDFWMGAPFHAMGMVDPRLTTTGYGAYRQAGATPWASGFALNVIQGNPFTGGSWPTYWPANGVTVPMRTYSGNESPNPLAGCPGYSGTVGLPVFVETGGFVTTSVSAHAFTGNGAPLAHCVIDGTTNGGAFNNELNDRGGVIVIPQAPLQPGVLYAVALTVNGTPYAWSFEVS